MKIGRRERERETERRETERERERSEGEKLIHLVHAFDFFILFARLELQLSASSLVGRVSELSDPLD
jgi:hypothetical protein